MRDYVPPISRGTQVSTQVLSLENGCAGKSHITKTMPDRAALRQDRRRCSHLQREQLLSPRAPSAVQLPHATA